VDVLLCPEVDAEVGQRRLERRQHPVRGKRRIPLRGAEEARDVPPLRLVEADADAAAKEAIG
jgi:hypothetical protein